MDLEASDSAADLLHHSQFRIQEKELSDVTLNFVYSHKNLLSDPQSLS